VVNKSQNYAIAKESMLYFNNLASTLKQIIPLQISKKKNLLSEELLYEI
jgi:hypothetical protein